MLSCHSVVLPLAAPDPATCTSQLAVTPVSSVLVYGRAVGLSEQELKTALGLMDGVALGQYNAYKVRIPESARGTLRLGQLFRGLVRWIVRRGWLCKG
jgi:hypothetical protein